MKQFSMRSTILCAGLSLILFSCGGDDSSTTSATETDSTTMAGTDTAMATPAVATPANYEVNPPYNLMVIMHKVANYDKWKTGYDNHDSARTASGIHNYVIARMLPDTSMVLVALKADDVDKAMAFGKSPGLKTAMKNGGVMGTPESHMYKVVYDATNPLSTDTRIIRNITVKDWAAWKASFDSTHQLRMDNGVEDRSIGYDATDNHKVMVVLALTDTAKANAFLNSDEMKKRMESAGVVGKPKVSKIQIVTRY